MGIGASMSKGMAENMEKSQVGMRNMQIEMAMKQRQAMAAN